MKRSTEIPPARDAQLKRLAKKIAKALLVWEADSNPAHHLQLVSLAADEGRKDAKWLYGFGLDAKDVAGRVLTHLRRAEIARQKSVERLKGAKITLNEMRPPVRPVKSEGILWLVVDADERNVSSLLTRDEAERFTAWVNDRERLVRDQRSEIARMRKESK
jgi:hypothetical protein